MTKLGRLVLAGRFNSVMKFGDVPFYSAPTVPFIGGDVTRLGGHATLRGLSMTASSAMRPRTARGNCDGVLLKRYFEGSTFASCSCSSWTLDSVGETQLSRIGISMAWNLSMEVSFDCARSGEGNLIYKELRHQF